MKNVNNNPKTVRFTPAAWAKLLFMRDMTDNEVGGFGITNPSDLLLVTDFVLVKQQVTCVSVAFDDDAVADFFEDMVESGRKPEQFARIWVHTHPGSSPLPSATDEETFRRVFGGCDWSVMAIVAQNSSSYAKIRFNTGPGCEAKIPVDIDYSSDFEGSDNNLWKRQYLATVKAEVLPGLTDKPKGGKKKTGIFDIDDFARPELLTTERMLEAIDAMDAYEREFFLEELAVRTDYWNEYESGVF